MVRGQNKRITIMFQKEYNCRDRDFMRDKIISFCLGGTKEAKSALEPKEAREEGLIWEVEEIYRKQSGRI